MNSVIKKEFTVSKGLFVPVYPNIASAPEPSIGGVAYDNSTQLLLLSDGITWYSPSTPSATPTTEGLVFGTTSEVDPSTTALGFNTGTATGENVFLGRDSGRTLAGNQTNMTFIGRSSGELAINKTDCTFIGNLAGVGALLSTQSSMVSIGYSASGFGEGTDCVSLGNGSQIANDGSRSCSIGSNNLGQTLSPLYDDCVVIGNNRLTSPQSCTGVIDIGSSAAQWPSGDSDDVIYVGGGTDLSANITNVVALGSGTFAGAAVTDNTFAIADDITQLRSLGLSVAASANILQFDPVTGLITQAASSKRFKKDIQDISEDTIPSLENLKVCTYEIDGQTDRGVISEDIPELFATFDQEGRRNGVIFARFVMALLSEIQDLKKELVNAREKRSF